MIRESKVELFANIYIKPFLSLALTAEKLGKALGGIKFSESDAHDGVPIYDAHALSLHLVLFGIPEEKLNAADSEGKPHEFLLKIRSEISVADEIRKVDFSNYFAQAIEANSDLRCRVSENGGL